MKKSLEEYVLVSRHLSCNLCLSCPVCRGLWDLFDPNSPGEYVGLCKVCGDLVQLFKERLGKIQGFLLFAHTDLSKEELEKLTRFLLDEKRIKKVYILQLARLKIGSRATSQIGQIEHIQVKESAFRELLEDEEFRYELLYEIQKDRYH
jgi:hypothetical protein